jgi:hypothetical protein
MANSDKSGDVMQSDKIFKHFADWKMNMLTVVEETFGYTDTMKLSMVRWFSQDHF